jgi:hypothetical protein
MTSTVLNLRPALAEYGEFRLTADKRAEATRCGDVKAALASMLSLGLLP